MSAFNVMLMKSYFVTAVPYEIIEAAEIDGASALRTLSAVVVPMARPIIATIALFAGLRYWNDWNNGYIYLVKRTDLFSIQNLLNRLMQNINSLAQNASEVASVSAGLSEIPSVTVRSLPRTRRLTTRTRCAIFFCTAMRSNWKASSRRPLCSTGRASRREDAGAAKKQSHGRTGTLSRV